MIVERARTMEIAEQLAAGRSASPLCDDRAAPLLARLNEGTALDGVTADLAYQS